MKKANSIDLRLIGGRYVGAMTRMLPLLALLAAAPAGALTVDQAVKQARDHNLGMAVEDLKLRQKADEKNFSYNRLYPSLSVNSTVLRLNQINLNQWEAIWPAITNGAPFSAFSGEAEKEDNHWVLAAGIKVQWILNPAVFRGIAQTLIDYDNAILTREGAASKLDRDVRKAFYQLLALHSATDVFQSQLKVAEDRFRVAKANADAGLGSEISALQAQVAFENRKPALADQQVNETNAESGFRLLINVPEGTDLNLEGSLDVDPAVLQALRGVDVDALVARYLEGRWDVSGAKGAARSLQNIAQLQADSLWPTFILGWTADPTVQAPF